MANKLDMYTLKGVKQGSVSLPKSFDKKLDLKTFSQAIYVYQDRIHTGKSKVKTRSEVTSSGAKIYRQKGTGRARHGDIKAPIFVGGGIAHGPKGVKRTLKLSRNHRKMALNKALDLKAIQGTLVFVEKLGSIAKTKEANALIDKIKKELKLNENAKTLVSLADANIKTARSFRNIKNVVLSPWSKLNPLAVYTSSLMIVDKEALDQKVEEKKPTAKESVNSEVTVDKAKKDTKKAKKAKAPEKVKKGAAKAKSAKSAGSKGRKKK